MQFGKAVQALTDLGVDFVVIGGLAATFHGSSQVTYDLDICYSALPLTCVCWPPHWLRSIHVPEVSPPTCLLSGMKPFSTTEAYSLARPTSAKSIFWRR
jgi:hypothetical protein